MKAKDLMVGDWMRHANGKCYQVTRIDGLSDGNVHFACGTPHLWEYNNKFEPIPITSEILEANGFIKDEEKDTDVIYHLLIPTGLERNSFTVQVTLYKEPICGVNKLVKCWGWMPPYNSGLNDIHLCGAEYVHELQHALRVCGIDKEIIIKTKED